MNSREKDKRAEREWLPERPTKIVLTRFLRVRKIPIGQEAPEEISVRVRRENCQSKKTRDGLQPCGTVHGQDSEGLLLYY